MNLPDRLFWDIDITSVDTNKNARFIIQRVIQKGSIQDWTVIKEFYGLDYIKCEILMMRSLDPKTLNFFSTCFDIDKKNFRCYSTQQLIPPHYSF
jgi:hypothetical protein